MKKTLSFVGLISLILIIGFALVNCGGGGGSPTSVVKQLHTAIEKGDDKKINELMTPEAAGMLIMMLEKVKGTVAEYGKITKTEETITDDKAVVKVTYNNGQEGSFDLIKVDGKWKVNFSK
jgi:hypothetical protein